MEHMIEPVLFYQLAAILVLAGAIGFVAVQCRQPLIIAFILTGILAGPDMFHVIGTQDSVIIETLAQFGIALLLFMVGLKLDVRLIHQTGLVTLATGVLQVLLTCVFGFILSVVLGYDFMTSFFIALALSFSSTIIVVKMLSDKRVIDSLYGRISLGILIVQDLAVILATVLITTFLGLDDGAKNGAAELYMIPFKAIVLVIGTGLFIRYIANPLTKALARNGELMLIFCIAFAVFMAALCDTISFSKELGGLLAGIALASTPYNNIIAARLAALRDFLLLFFFVNLGAHMSLTGIGAQMLPALVFSVFVLFGKPLIIMVVMHLMRYRKRTGFMAGLTLSQISEFSLILMAMGLSSGLVDQDALNLVTLIGLITMGVSTYAIAHSSTIFSYLEDRTAIFRRSESGDYLEEQKNEEDLRKDYDVIIFGLGRYGSALARLFQKKGHDILAIDFDPEAIDNAQEMGITAIYGDAADPEFLAHLPLDRVQVVIFSFHHYITGPLITDLRRTLAKALRERGYKGHIAATSHHPEHDKDLPEHGIDIVMGPFEDAAYHGMEQIMSTLGQNIKKTKG